MAGLEDLYREIILDTTARPAIVANLKLLP